MISPRRPPVDYVSGPRRAYPAAELGSVVVPLRLLTDAGTLSLFSTTTVFGTPVDVTLSELALECFYPADAATAAALRSLADPSA
jgi:hypothetical protein